MIRRVEALNYRSLHYISQEVRPFQVLVGPNASGKSTFLDVVALLSDFVRYGVDDALLLGLDTGRGRARRLDELIFNQCCSHFELAIELTIPEHPDAHKRNGSSSSQYDLARYEVAFGKAELGELEIWEENLWLIDSRRRAPGATDVFPEILPTFPVEPNPPEKIVMIKNEKTPLGWKSIVKKTVQSGNHKYTSEKDNWTITYRGGLRRSALAGVPEDLDRFPVAVWVRNLLLEGIQVLALDSAAMRRAVSPSLSRRFSEDGANLPLVIQDLERDHRSSYQDWVAHVQTILPDLKEIHVYERPEDRHLYLAIQYNSTPEPVPSWLVSDGTLRLLALTLLAYLPAQSGIYLIEEPENGIHPKAIEGVFQSLSSVYQGQVFVATHSSLILGLAEPGQILCFAKNPSGAVSIVSGDKHTALQSWRGQIDLSTLYAAGVLG